MVTVSYYSRVQMFGMFCIIVRVRFSGFSSASEESERICQQLQCQNNSSCLVRTENDISQAECVCHDEWAGKRCEGVLHLATKFVKSSSAIFSVSYQVPPISNVHNFSVTDEMLSDFRFTIQYWTVNGSNFMCSIIPDVDSETFTILGLQSSTTYYVCAKSVHVDRCFPSQNLVMVDQNLTRNCIILVTLNSTAEIENQDGTPVYAIPLSAALAVVLLVILVLIIIFFKLKKGKRSCISYENKKRNARQRHFSSDTSPELLLLTATPPTPHLTLSSSSSPGKHKDKQAKRTGPKYAVFNEKTRERRALATVIEYTPEGAMDEQENEIMEMITFRGRDKLADLKDMQKDKNNASA